MQTLPVTSTQRSQRNMLAPSSEPAYQLGSVRQLGKRGLDESIS